MPGSRAAKWWAGAALLVLCTAFFQWKSGAYSSDLASTPDEPAHVVSGLMIHDYVVRILRPGPAPLPLNPRAFAEAYYVHYPKVAIGHWPPLFYVVQAVWMLVFGRTKTALLLLMLAIVAITAILVWDHARRLAGDQWVALCAAAVFLLLAITQQSLSAVMPDAMLALLAAVAVRLAWGTPGKQMWLWMVATAAILVHARGAPLLVLPLLAIARNGPSNTFRQRSLWIAIAALLLVLPWLLFVRQTGDLSFASFVSAAAMFPMNMARALGVVPFAMTVLGAFVVPYREQKDWLGMTSIVLGTWLFFSFAIVPWDNRYLMLILPACILLMTGAWRWLALRVAPAVRLPSRVVVHILAIATAFNCLSRPPLWSKPNAGYEAAVRQVMNGPDAASTVYLIAGGPICEGAFVAGVDLADRPARHFVLRSSKVLSKSDWSGDGYQPLFQSPQEMAAFLAASPVSVVVIENSPAEQGRASRPDVEMLRTALGQTPSWLELPSAPQVRIYRRTLPLPLGPVTVRLDLRDTLHKYLEWTQ
jgi:hypothetical protein